MASIADLLSPEDLAKIRTTVRRSNMAEDTRKELEEAKAILLAFLHADIQDPKAREAITQAREFLTKQKQQEG